MKILIRDAHGKKWSKADHGQVNLVNITYRISSDEGALVT